jgi:hypothetical protein
MLNSNFKIFLFKINKQLKLIKKILINKGSILIIYSNPNIYFLKKKINIKNIYIIQQWLPGLLTNNTQKKPNLILYFNKNINNEVINEIYLKQIPLILFNNDKNLKKSIKILYKIKYSLNFIYFYCFLLFLNKYLKK